MNRHSHSQLTQTVVSLVPYGHPVNVRLGISSLLIPKLSVTENRVYYLTCPLNLFLWAILFLTHNKNLSFVLEKENHFPEMPSLGSKMSKPCLPLIGLLVKEQFALWPLCRVWRVYDHVVSTRSSKMLSVPFTGFESSNCKSLFVLKRLEFEHETWADPCFFSYCGRREQRSSYGEQSLLWSTPPKATCPRKTWSVFI